MDDGDDSDVVRNDMEEDRGAPSSASPGAVHRMQTSRSRRPTVPRLTLRTHIHVRCATAERGYHFRTQFHQSQNFIKYDFGLPCARAMEPSSAASATAIEFVS